MIISEKQITQLMNFARIMTLQREISFTLQNVIKNLIQEIEEQQSEELKEIE